MPYTAKARSTVFWGTKNLGYNFVANLIVDSITYTPKDKAPIEIEDGDGDTVGMKIPDGTEFNATLHCLSETNASVATYPAIGDTVILKRVTNNTNVNVIVVSIEETAKRKDISFVDIDVMRRPSTVA